MKRKNRNIFVDTSKMKKQNKLGYYDYGNITTKKEKEIIKMSDTWFFGKYGTFQLNEVCYIRCNDNPDEEQMAWPEYTVYNWEHKEIGDLSAEEYDRIQEQLGEM